MNKKTIECPNCHFSGYDESQIADGLITNGSHSDDIEFDDLWSHGYFPIG